LPNVILKQGQKGNSMVITHEQGVLTRVLGLNNKELTVTQFS
jgi:hypothetical protein